MRRSIPPYVCLLGAGQVGLEDHPVHAMACPAVASAIGANNQIIAAGETGFLARDAADWLTHLRTLRDDPELRERLGAAARRCVEQHFALQVAAPILIDQIKAILKAKSTSVAD